MDKDRQKCDFFTQKNVCALGENHSSPFFIFCVCVEKLLRDNSVRFQCSDLLSSFSFFSACKFQQNKKQTALSGESKGAFYHAGEKAFSGFFRSLVCSCWGVIPKVISMQRASQCDKKAQYRFSSSTDHESNSYKFISSKTGKFTPEPSSRPYPQHSIPW